MAVTAWLAAFASALDPNVPKHDTARHPRMILPRPAGGADVAVAFPPERSFSHHRPVVGIDAFPDREPGGQPTGEIAAPAGSVGLAPWKSRQTNSCSRFKLPVPDS
jgi:hypothetical protein